MVGPLLICCEVSFEKIRKKEHLQDNKQNNKLDANDFP